jgi:hypothetical protein
MQKQILATDNLELVAERKALRFLAENERKYSAIVQDLRKVGGDPDAIALAEVRLRTVQVEIDAVLLRNSREWAESILPRAYLQGRENVRASLQVVAAHDRNVRSLLATFKNFGWDPESEALISGGYRMASDAFQQWNAGTAEWLQDEFAKARRSGIPVGNYSDIGTDRDTLTNRLYKSPNKLRGRTIKTVTGKTIHIPPERTALNLARVEVTRISNDAAEIEAERIGLDYAYNANPMDSETTPVCQAATDAGVLPKAELIANHGKPPRLDPFHYCRSKLVYVRKEWVEETSRSRRN